MVYLISLLAAVVGVVVLLTLLLLLAARVRRLAGTIQVSRGAVARRIVPLAAQIAELRRGLDRWRQRHRDSDGSHPTPAA